jgi:tetratricopeptide (TPR) repeat protein
MSKACFWGSCLTLAVCLSVVFPPSAARAEGAFERHIAEAVRLYDDLEYELALEQLERASKVPHGTEEEVTLGLYKGIISADLGRWEAARAGFKSALVLKPDAQLPLRVSPKVRAEFESQRTKVQAELARKRKDTPKLAESRPAAPVPDAMTPVAPTQVMPSQPEPREEVARPELVPSRPEETAPRVTAGKSWARRVPVVSLVLLGAGVAAGGAGTVYGLSSRSQLKDARGAQFREELVERHGQAQRSAKTANLLFGTAGAAAAGALVTWLLMGDSATPMAQGGAR